MNLNPQEYPEESAKNDRPCLVIQSDSLNDAGYSSTIIVPCTTVTYRDREGDGYPLKVNLGPIQKPGFNPEDTDAYVAGIRSISNRRFRGDKAIAIVARNHMKRIEDALKLILGL